MAMAMANMGMMTDLYPRANPKFTFIAAPILQKSATSFTGLQYFDDGYKHHIYKLMGTIHTNIHKSVSSIRRCTMKISSY